MSAPEESGTGPELTVAASQRRTFLPVVAVGLASTGFLAYAGHQPMLRVPSHALSSIGMASIATEDASEIGFPLAGACALVALASWGVLLVVRGRLRQVVAALATLGNAGVCAVLVVGGFIQDDEAADAIADQLGLPGLAGRLPLESTPWFWPTLVVSVVAVLASVAAVLLAPAWPEMGSRYDAPSAHEGRSPGTPVEERTSLDLWKSMDEGQDPTAE